MWWSIKAKLDTEAINCRRGQATGRVAEGRFPLIFSGDLEGKAAGEYSERLSLADGVGVRGAESIYVYRVMSAGDVQESSQMTVVSAGRITKTTWPIADF